ncbi:unnamed protein product, partial [Amoebophrya sp. A25]
ENVFDSAVLKKTDYRKLPSVREVLEDGELAQMMFGTPSKSNGAPPRGKRGGEVEKKARTSLSATTSFSRRETEIKASSSSSTSSKGEQREKQNTSSTTLGEENEKQNTSSPPTWGKEEEKRVARQYLELPGDDLLPQSSSSTTSSKGEQKQTTSSSTSSSQEEQKASSPPATWSKNEQDTMNKNAPPARWCYKGSLSPAPDFGILLESLPSPGGVLGHEEKQV